MAAIIAILEDNLERQGCMFSCLHGRLSQVELRCFGDAQQMITFLQENLTKVALISLDHDLELLTNTHGECIDPGDGRQVADFLSGRVARCPVILHSTNTVAVQGMTMVLEDAGWQVIRVAPFEGTAWIESTWRRTVQNLISPVTAIRNHQV